MSTEKILITGSNGLLGQKIVKLCLSRGLSFVATSNGENRNSNCPKENYISMDITNPAQVREVIGKTKPSFIAHTAAMTNVDQCEVNPKECEKINVLGTKLLFDEAQKINAHLQLLSTDFVFDGEKGNYSETDKVHPLSVYARSKVEAENVLLKSTYQNWSIVRTIIVYGTGENLSRTNIVLWAREALKEEKPLNIVDDQFRAPTWAEDLAWGCLEIERRNETGIFHLSGPITRSILELVKEIADFYGLSTTNLNAISSKTLNQAAHRPPKTGFDLLKSRNQLGYDPLDIKEALDLLEKELISKQF
ncbi:MAG: SDR family oxidoreductase [Bacteroidetes bacterium]|nr:SDR family oxidoreductase [Bacteroidota bacterium]